MAVDFESIKSLPNNVQLMKLVVFGQNLYFLQKELAAFKKEFEVKVFSKADNYRPSIPSKLNEKMFNKAIRSHLQWADVAFFEWAEHNILDAIEVLKTMKKRPKVIVRLHSYELNVHAKNIDWSYVDK